MTGPTVSNAAVGRVFGLIADLLEIKGGDDAAKAPTYRRAARFVESFPEEVTALAGQDRLREIPGVGEALSRKIAELVETGRLRYFERLNSEIPSGVLDLLRVPGVGVKTAGLVWRELGVAGVDKLEEACRQGRLRDLSGLGAKKEEAILEGIAAYRLQASGHPLGLARPVGEALVRELEAIPGVVEAAVAGSVRRWRDLVGNLDLVAATDAPAAVADAFTGLPEVREVGEREFRDGPSGPSGRVRATLHCGLGVDLRLVPPGRFGAALGYFTGSVDHNRRLAERAGERGATFDEDGLRGPAGEDLSARTEVDFYRGLGLPFIPPELREGRGEVEAAASEGGLPRLLELGDIRGDLHVHSTWSDGRATLEELAAAGERLGYDYIAVSDHSKSLAMAGGLDEKRILEQIQAIRDLNAGLAEGACRLLAGVEADILADGGIDLEDAVLAQLDIVTASIHSRLRQPGPQISQRLEAAAKNEHVDVLGHPSGRLIGYRGASELDLGAVLEAAARTGTMLEINASPERLDLRDDDVRRARQAGCRLTISTDAHHCRSLEDMPYGVALARRAWLGPEDVANTRSLAELRKLLGS